MKEKKKVKRFKRILPFICATLLLLGSCMTVCAADYSDVDLSQYVDEYPYYFIFQYPSAVSKGRVDVVFNKEPIIMSYFGGDAYNIDNRSDCIRCITYDNGATWTTYSVSGSSGFTYTELSSSIYTNHNIYLDNGSLFFQCPLATLAVPLKMTVQKQTATILPIAVGCLALLIGSLILVPKLKIFVLK